jgi:hypothetical protein
LASTQVSSVRAAVDTDRTRTASSCTEASYHQGLCFPSYSRTSRRTLVTRCLSG